MARAAHVVALAAVTATAVLHVVALVVAADVSASHVVETEVDTGVGATDDVNRRPNWTSALRSRGLALRGGGAGKPAIA